MKIQDVKACRGPSCGSDPYLLKTIVVLPNRNEQQDQKQVRYNLDNLIHDSVKLFYQQRLNDKLKNKTFSTTEEHYEYIKNCIHATAKEALVEYENQTKDRKDRNRIGGMKISKEK